jgi:hypothetical protein
MTRGPSPLCFDATAHAFTFEGVRVPHVTMLSVPKTVKDQLEFLSDGRPAERGTRIHKLTVKMDLASEQNQRRIIASASAEDQRYLRQWAVWKAVNRPHFTHIETPLYRDDLRVAGIVDRIGILTTSRYAGEVVLDIKTCAPAKHHGVQLAAYDLLAPYRGSLPRRRLGVYLRDGQLIVREYEDPEDYTVFLSRLESYWRTHNG